ncbi:MAG: RNA polymerase sigma factor, partial [Planctomycetota bacterium]
METIAATNSEGVLLEELGWLRTLARRLMADPNDAEDVVQEAWLRTREVVEDFPSRNRLRAWLAGFAYRMARDTVRARRRRERREEVAALSARQDAEDGVERLAALESLLHTVRMLDEPLRAVVLLRYLDGHTTAEIAAALRISEDLVRKRLSRGRSALRRALGVPAEAGARAGGRGLVLGAGALLLAGLAAALWVRGRGEPEPVLGVPVALEPSPAVLELPPEASSPSMEASVDVAPAAPLEAAPVAEAEPAPAAPLEAPSSEAPTSDTPSGA